MHPPPLMEGEAVASRVLELGPAGAKFLGPVIIEVPHFAALRGREREIVILRSDNGETWREHTLEATEDAVQVHPKFQISRNLFLIAFPYVLQHYILTFSWRLNFLAWGGGGRVFLAKRNMSTTSATLE